MNKYELYNKVLECLDKDESTFNAVARNWIEGTNEANFKNEKAEELFIRAKQCCAIWRSGAINSRISKRRMIEYVREIAKMNLPNPYDPNEVVPEPVLFVQEEPKAVEVKEEIPFTEKPVVAEEPVAKEEPTHVLGVVPEEKKLFSRHKKR
jgi:hypothetical protein